MSAATLVGMAKKVLDRSLSSELKETLEGIARHKAAATAEERVEDLLSSASARFGSGELAMLSAHERFRWWLFTLSHSSIIMVPIAENGERSIIKMGYQEPIHYEIPWRTSLGWRPYSLHVDSSFVGGCSYHFEAHSPAGLRIDGSSLASDRPTVRDEGMLRRTHLYLPDSARGGAATAVLALRVAGSGFVRDAWLAGFLVALAIAACINWAENIVENSTSAPALLLVLPGLIATYLGRPDRHGLTQRLLTWHRRTLMLLAFLAYGTAARVALAGGKPKSGNIEGAAHTLQCQLAPALVVAAIATTVLLVVRLRSDHKVAKARSSTGTWLTRRRDAARSALSGRFIVEQEINGNPDDCAGSIQRAARELCGSGARFEHDVSEHRLDDWHFFVSKTLWPGYFELDFLLHPTRDGTRIECCGVASGKRIVRIANPVRVLWHRRRARKAFKRLAEQNSSDNKP